MNLENAAVEGAAEGTVAGASYRELTQSLTNIVDAMRDFLQNFRMASEHLQPGENEENDTTDEDTSDYFD
ncbi:hypothetical protein DOY81_014503 [Sarcophaga bullata]|nr:hypothetical protein DOY81_014503 [Sarcophaga bullata]